LEAEGKRLIAAVCNENPMNAYSRMARCDPGLRWSSNQQATSIVCSGSTPRPDPLSTTLA